MNSLQQDYAAGLFDEAPAPPCLTLYQPTHRVHPENQQDPIRFRNLLRTLEEALARQHASRDITPLLRPLAELAADQHFWDHVRDGLAVLRTRDIFRVYHLQRRVPELAVTADTFHTKPLLRVLQSADRYQVLGINRHTVRLFEGNRDALDEIEPAEGVPVHASSVIGDTAAEPHLTVKSHGSGAGAQTTFHGHGGLESTADLDAERFFRAVDRAVLDHHSKPSRLPLILAALPANRALFSQVSRNPFLLADGIDVHPDAISIDELRERSWKVLEPGYLARLNVLIDAFHAGRAHDRAHDDLAHIAAAIAARRVGTLLIDADRHIPGRVDTSTGRITFGSFDHANIDDVIDDLAAAALGQGAEVVVVPADRMPTATGAAATYRF